MHNLFEQWPLFKPNTLAIPTISLTTYLLQIWFSGSIIMPKNC